MFKHSPNRRWLGFELSVLRRLKFASLAVPFAGQPDLEWYLKFWGKQAITNDLCQWAWWMSRALDENQGERLTEEDVWLVLQSAYEPQTRLYNVALHNTLNELDAVWFDNIWQNIQLLPDEPKRAMAYTLALGVADYLFAFDQTTRDLRRPLSQVFLQLWRTQRKLVNNGQSNAALNQDAHEFVRNARTDLLFVRFPRPQGMAGLRGTLAGWRETFVRGHEMFWDELITAQRGKEVLSMRWADVDGGWWTIPADIAKNKLPHRVWLSAPALRVLATLKGDGQRDHVFKGIVGPRQRRGALEGLEVNDVRPHDFRRTAASTMASGRVPRLTISKILNHMETGVTAIYDRHSYDPEKKAALIWWGAKLDAIVNGKRSRVLPFARGA